MALYRAHHQTVMLTLTKLMPGVAEAIPELARRGFRQGVCSNKRVEFTRQLVQMLGLAAHFECVLGPEDVGDRPKPDPAMLLEGLSRLGVSAGEAIYIGDMTIDVQTARTAGVTVWLVPGGAAGLEAAEQAEPDRVLTGFAELPVLLENPS
jgi:phosphoglycolate phosphatase